MSPFLLFVVEFQLQHYLIGWKSYLRLFHSYIPFLTYSAEELRQVDGEFTASDFVEKQVGVDNVCERAALKACGAGGELIVRKCAENGMTIAVARRVRELYPREQRGK